MAGPKIIEIDGRTGEGGGQLVRMAVALASVITQPIRITHIRGNRPGNKGTKGGGLKSQHVSSITWLATATDAEVNGLSVGSHTLEFRPQKPPSAFQFDGKRRIKISADSAAASTLLIFQAVLPFILFIGIDNPIQEPIEIELSGGTNVSFSMSYEYLDQILLPALEDRFGIVVRRTLVSRGWSHGTASRGTVKLRVMPLRLGTSLRLRDDCAPRPAAADPAVNDFEVAAVDASLVLPADLHGALQRAVVRDVGELWPDAEVNFVVVEDSGKDARAYVLLVARAESGLRWGRDVLTSVPKAAKGKPREVFADELSRQVAKELFEEVAVRGHVDVYLQDQLVIFQALAEGRTSFPHEEEFGDGEEVLASAKSPPASPGKSDGLDEAMEKLTVDEYGERMRRDKAREPFGEGSMHSKTARWVTAELLPQVRWWNQGRICDGVGMHMEKDA